MTATATPVKVSREILEDRYDGALVNQISVSQADGSESAGDYNDRNLRLDAILRELWEITARTAWPDPSEDLIGNIEKMIRAEILRHVEDSGLAQ